MESFESIIQVRSSWGASFGFFYHTLKVVQKSGESNFISQRNKYSFLSLAGATMIMDISIELTLTTVGRPPGDQNQTMKLTKSKYFYFISGPNPDEPCIFPFTYWETVYDKCKPGYFGSEVWIFLAGGGSS